MTSLFHSQFVEPQPADTSREVHPPEAASLLVRLLPVLRRRASRCPRPRGQQAQRREEEEVCLRKRRRGEN